MTADLDGQAGAARAAVGASHESGHDLQQGDSPAMIEIAGGAGAPARARQWARTCVVGGSNGSGPDVALIISELVTNSVIHAQADSTQLVRITIARLKDCLRIAVIDNGSGGLPHLRDSGDGTAGGLGLRIVDGLCLSWGVARNGAGPTEVWCTVALS